MKHIIVFEDVFISSKTTGGLLVKIKQEQFVKYLGDKRVIREVIVIIHTHTFSLSLTLTHTKFV